MKKHLQHGATIIEFALVLLLFLTFLLGITDMSRMLFMWSAASEATRAGARYAVVCDDKTRETQVLARMQALMPEISAIEVNWIPDACTVTTCQGVEVRITGLIFHWVSPIFGMASALNYSLPGFSSYLTREMMWQDPNSATICS
jgi:hypothetical protein